MQFPADNAFAVVANVACRPRGQQRNPQPVGDQGAHDFHRWAFVGNVRGHADGAKKREKVVAAVRQANQNERLARQFRQAQPGLARQGVAPGQQGVGLQLGDGLQADAARQAQVVQQRHIERAALKLMRQGFGIALDELNLDARAGHAQARKNVGQVAWPQRAQAADPQATHKFNDSWRLQRLGLAQHGPGLAHAHRASRREFKTPRMQSNEQALAPQRLQLGNGLGDGGLRDMQLLRRTRGAAMVRSCNQVFKLTKAEVNHYFSSNT